MGGRVFSDSGVNHHCSDAVRTSSESNLSPLCYLVALLLGLRECEWHDEEGEQDWDAISFES
jgi:hypothetical protein